MLAIELIPVTIIDTLTICPFLKQLIDIHTEPIENAIIVTIHTEPIENAIIVTSLPSLY